ncbi:hypothetical protein GCM10017688_41810 [Streptomyces ramulosus]
MGTLLWGDGRLPAGGGSGGQPREAGAPVGPGERSGSPAGYRGPAGAAGRGGGGGAAVRGGSASSARAGPAAVPGGTRGGPAAGRPPGVAPLLTSAVGPGTPCIVDSLVSSRIRGDRGPPWYGKIVFAIRITRVAVPIAHLGGGG